MSSCTAQKNILITQVENTGAKQVLQDSFLNKLRGANDIVIASAVENFAWAKSIHYHIIALNNNIWKGYEYTVDMRQQNASYTINTANVNTTACDSLINFLNKESIWNVKGDNGENFCTNTDKRCNINDATTSRLWIITKKKFINPSYYAPAFFEKCCPDKNRSLFISVLNKIESSLINNM